MISFAKKLWNQFERLASDDMNRIEQGIEDVVEHANDDQLHNHLPLQVNDWGFNPVNNPIIASLEVGESVRVGSLSGATNSPFGWTNSLAGELQRITGSGTVGDFALRVTRAEGDALVIDRSAFRNFNTITGWSAWSRNNIILSPSTARSEASVNWSNIGAAFSNMQNGDMTLIRSSASSSTNGPFGVTSAHGMLLRFNGNNAAIIAYRTQASSLASDRIAFRRLVDGTWRPWVYTTTTTTFAMPLSVEFGNEQVEVCINDITEYQFNKMSDDEKRELVEYIKNKPKLEEREVDENAI